MTKNQPTCTTCGATGHGVQFPIFPLSGAKFGDVCVECDQLKQQDDK
jgi:hypothetical protein